MIPAPITMIEIASQSALALLTIHPMRPARIAEAAINIQMIFVASCLNDSKKLAGGGSGFLLAPNL